MLDIFRPFRIFKNVASDEAKEIASLSPTDEDKEQARKITAICIAAMASQGILVPPLAEPVIEKAVLYTLRDLKDGLRSPDRLILSRVLREIRKEYHTR